MGMFDWVNCCLNTLGPGFQTKSLGNELHTYTIELDGTLTYKDCDSDHEGVSDLTGSFDFYKIDTYGRVTYRAVFVEGCCVAIDRVIEDGTKKVWRV